MHDAERRDFWQALMTVCERELQEAVKQDHIDRARLRGEPVPEQYLQREQGLHSHLDQDVQGMLAGEQLQQAEGVVQAILAGGRAELELQCNANSLQAGACQTERHSSQGSICMSVSS